MTKAPAVIVADFETEGIEARPKYPPKPVSLALKWPDTRAYELLAWGHGDGSKAAGNNCTEKEARGRYKAARESRWPMLFQNGIFDQDVAETYWDIPLLPDDRYHDTMFLLFLHDPHSPTLALKPCAERYLGVSPEERDRMYEWIIANVPEAKRKPSTAGAYISRCPYQIVKPYHKGDLTRTGGLFDYLWPLVIDAGMEEAYLRELKLMPILLQNARRGMRLDVEGLGRDLPLMQQGLATIDGWLRKRLGDINLDSPKQLGDALAAKGVVTKFRATAKGQRSVSKKSLTIDLFKDKNVYQALTYRGQMDTSIGMFMEPWLDLAQYDGLLHGDWAQVRSSKGDRDDSKGARSGRIICSKPNLLNIPKKWKKSITAGYVHPTFVKVPQLPFMRKYVLPSKGKQWGRRDYNQQEVRLFGHFEEGPVMAGFLSDPLTRPCPKCGAPIGRKCAGGTSHTARDFDMHEGVRAEEEIALVAAGLRDEFDRDSAKTTVFGAFYGQGLTGLMVSLKIPEEEKPVGKLIHQALHRAAPSIRELSDALKALALDKDAAHPNGHPIRTIGGRLYYCEPPQYSEKYGRDMTFEYKLISYLIQGSGADVTKQAIINYYEHPARTEELNVTVYDELDIDVPLSAKGAKHEMTVLRDCMFTATPCDVPLRSDGEVGPNWGTLEEFAV